MSLVISIYVYLKTLSHREVVLPDCKYENRWQIRRSKTEHVYDLQNLTFQSHPPQAVLPVIIHKGLSVGSINSCGGPFDRISTGGRDHTEGWEANFSDVSIPSVIRDFNTLCVITLHSMKYGSNMI